MRLLSILIRLVRPARTPRRIETPAPRPGIVRPKPSTPTARKVEAAVTQVPPFVCGPCWVTDGDTIIIRDTRIRLFGIDAPELDHPWGQKAKWKLVELCRGQTVTARTHDHLSYDRLVATCYLDDGRDLSAEMVRAGLALDWPSFSGGRYRHLEPDGIRKRHWRAAARQRTGRLPV